MVVLTPTRAMAAEEILCSTYPVYLFTQNIVQGRDFFTPRMLDSAPAGCPHDYAPTPADLEHLSQARLLLINGLGLEAFLPRAIRVARADIKIIDASGGEDFTTAPQDDIFATPVEAHLFITKNELMSMGGAGDGHDHSHDEVNPHIFAAPSTAALMVANIASALSQLDPEGQALYRQNANRLIGELTALAQQFKEVGQLATHPNVIATHSVFDYLAQDMGINIVAKIEEEDGAALGAAHLASLVTLAKEKQIQAIWADPNDNVSAARVLGAETGILVVIIDPVSSGPPMAPLDYYQKVMSTNINVLSQLFTLPPEDKPAGDTSGNRKK
ncbi:MAG: metal ABC transporter substrate-binding protein [Candidatus Adiutrix sp.]